MLKWVISKSRSVLTVIICAGVLWWRPGTRSRNKRLAPSEPVTLVPPSRARPMSLGRYRYGPVTTGSGSGPQVIIMSRGFWSVQLVPAFWPYNNLYLVSNLSNRQIPREWCGSKAGHGRSGPVSRPLGSRGRVSWPRCPQPPEHGPRPGHQDHRAVRGLGSGARIRQHLLAWRVINMLRPDLQETSGLWTDRVGKVGRHFYLFSLLHDSIF